MVNDFIELTINGEFVDIENIISCSFDDSAGVKSDRVTLKMMPSFSRPAPSSKVELFFKTFKNKELLTELNAGLFHLQTVTRSDNKALTITATGVEFNAKQKEKISHHYNETKLSSVIDIVAKRLGHKVKFLLDDVAVKSLNQTNETDINFLDRLAKDYNALFSIKNDFIYFINKDEDTLPVAKIDVSKCSSSSLKHSSKTFYKSCEASYHNVDTAKQTSVVVGDGEPLKKIHGAYKDEVDAKVKAEAHLKMINKGIVTGSFSLTGVNVYAGTKVELFNTYKGEDDGIYSVENCKHSWSHTNGWMTSLNIEN